MGLRQTDDEIVRRGDIWRGTILELHARKADFTVDGVRFGTLLVETKSGSPHDRRLTKRSEEIVTAAFILGRLGYEGVDLITKANDGADLERPDLDARFSDGTIVGIEIAQVGSTKRMKHDAHIAMLEHTIRDLIDSDSGFAEAFGPWYLTVNISSVLGERDVSSKKEAQTLTAEVIAFIRARAHRQDESEQDDMESGYFPLEYATLHSRGATYYAAPAAYGPYFGTMSGGTVNPNPETDEIIRVLDEHREQAKTYRMQRIWMLMYLPDSNEIFRHTIRAISDLKPPIEPFEQCHISDAVWNVVSLGV